MSDWSVEKTIKSADGTRMVEICLSPDRKLSRYYEFIWTVVEQDLLTFYPDGGYWSAPIMSGYYASLEECERGARDDLAWLKRRSSPSDKA